MPDLDQIFQLKISETALFADLNVSVLARDVVEDYRCPTNVDCNMPGWVTVSFHVTIEDIDYFFQLKLDPLKPQDAEKEIGGYKVRLVTVNPQPSNITEIALEDYSFSLVVENE